jgi:hypothetical protein
VKRREEAKQGCLLIIPIPIPMFVSCLHFESWHQKPKLETTSLIPFTESKDDTPSIKMIFVKENFNKLNNLALMCFFEF